MWLRRLRSQNDSKSPRFGGHADLHSSRTCRGIDVNQKIRRAGLAAGGAAADRRIPVRTQESGGAVVGDSVVVAGHR